MQGFSIYLCEWGMNIQVRLDDVNTAMARLRFDVSVGLFTGTSFEAQVKKWGASRDAK